MNRCLAAVVVVVLVAVVGGLVATSVSDGGYNAVGNGVALGPARQYQSSGLDVVARGARDALHAAAGSADGVPPAPADAEEIPQEQQLQDLVNQERASRGLGALVFDPSLLHVAHVRAAAQLQDGPLSHYAADGQLAFVGLLADAGVSYSLAGENLARSTATDPAVVGRLHTALMESPTHRANILQPLFTSLAIGEAPDASGRLAFAQIFRAAP